MKSGAAPSTTLRVVPLPRFASASQGRIAQAGHFLTREAGGGGPAEGRWVGAYCTC